jgi:hypothetical protein
MRVIARRTASERLPLWAAVGTVVIASAFVLIPASRGGAGAVPALSVDPASGPPLASFQVTGTGFCPTPCSPVAISVKLVYVASDVTVAPDGSFSAIVRVPKSARSGHTSVAASQTDQNGEPVSASSQFDVTPIETSPTQYSAPSAVPAATATTSTHPGNGVHTEAATAHGSPGGGSGSDWLIWAGLALLVAAGGFAGVAWYRYRHAGS